MKKLVEMYCELPKGIKKPLWRFWHKVMLKMDVEQNNLFMNYGFASENGTFENLKLKSEDEPYRYFIQLYDFVTRAHNFENTHILEVGSGRGGGAAFLTEYKKPARYTAMDISQPTIDFCNKHYNLDALSFKKGEAESLPFEDESFDAVVNVESARCYNDIGKFFSETWRVLRPEGRFLFADMIKQEDVPEVRSKLIENGFYIENETDIRENVLLALKKNSERNKEEIKKRVSKIFQAPFYEFAGIEGSNRYNEFYSSEMSYRSFSLKKKS